RELKRRPHAEQAELAALYVKRGLSAELAAQVARELSRHPESLWRSHHREELGGDPDSLPSPYVAAFSSLFSFAIGAFVPLVPYAIGVDHLWLALALAAVALAALGATVAGFTARPRWKGAVRQLGLGAAAAGITYA